MPQQLVEQILKTLQFAADHRVDVETVCLNQDDFDTLQAIGIGSEDRGIVITAALIAIAGHSADRFEAILSLWR